jgi:hypothetical protein
LDERKTNFMHLFYIFIVAVGDAALAVVVRSVRRFAPPPPAQRPQHTAQNTYAIDLVF